MYFISFSDIYVKIPKNIYSIENGNELENMIKKKSNSNRNSWQASFGKILNVLKVDD